MKDEGTLLTVGRAASWLGIAPGEIAANHDKIAQALRNLGWEPRVGEVADGSGEQVAYWVRRGAPPAQRPILRAGQTTPPMLLRNGQLVPWTMELANNGGNTN